MNLPKDYPYYYLTSYPFVRQPMDTSPLVGEDVLNKRRRKR